MNEVTRDAANELTDARVTAHFAAIKSAEAGLKAIREACAHPSYFVGWWEDRPGRYSATRVCAVCRIYVKGITDDERARLGPMFPKRTVDEMWEAADAFAKAKAPAPAAGEEPTA